MAKDWLKGQIVPRRENDIMNKTTTSRIATVFGVALLAGTTGCVSYVDDARHGHGYTGDAGYPGYSRPRADYYGGGAGSRDDYVYYPRQQIYYSSNRGHYIYQEGRSWITRPAPPRIAANALATSPSVRMDFHDSPANHHATVARQYPKHWTPSGNDSREAKGNRDKIPGSVLGHSG